MRFTDGELKVMRLLWKHGELKPAELQDLFPETIKNPALRSYLAILLEKGHVTRRKVGKAFVYRAKTAEQRVFSRLLGDLIENFCGGSATRLLLALARRENLTPEQLAELTAAAGVESDSPQPDEVAEPARKLLPKVKPKKNPDG